MSSDPRPTRLGVGLWTMQSTRQAPAPFPLLYRRFAEAVALADVHGLDSVWASEHRVWYDGWCPAPLHALGLAAARTRRLHLGTAVALGPQHSPGTLTDAVLTLDRLSGGRVELGLGLGHREAEFDALGVARSQRGRRMDQLLDRLSRQAPEVPVWIGGMARPAIERAARFESGLLLPQSIGRAQAERLADLYERRAGRRPRICVLRDMWLTDDEGEAARVRRRLRAHYEEEVGSWWRFGQHVGFEDPASVAAQLDRLGRCALVGPAADVAAELERWVESGAELIVARVNFDFVPPDDLAEQLTRLSRDVAPRLRAEARV